MRKSLSRSIGLLFVVHSCFLQAMIIDSRFVPLLWKPFFSVQGRPSHVMPSLFVTTASQALLQNDSITGIPEMFGDINTSGGMYQHAALDVNALGQALELVGKPNPLGDLAGMMIPYRQEGKMQAQGAMMVYQQAIGDLVSVGGSCLFMRFLSTQRFLLDKSSVNMSHTTIEDAVAIDVARRAMFQELGLTQPVSDQAGVGDFDFYLRLGKTWDYSLKCKSLTFGGRAGLLAPAGQSRNIFSSASVPFGGDGHWGMYLATDFEAEVKEYWKVGLLARVNKRFARASRQRLSVAGEPTIFGALLGNVKINPGFTGLISPYAELDNIRAGLGVRVQYTMTKHGKDTWTILCKDVPSLNPGVCLEEAVSRWSSDYITLDAFYDFGSMKAERSFDPTMFFSWDIPVDMLVARGIPRMYKVSLGMDISF